MKRRRNLSGLVFALAIPLAFIPGCDSKGDAPAEVVPGSAVTEPSATGGSEDYASFSYSDGIDENGFFKDVTALDYVEDFNYRALPVPADVHQVSPEALQAEIDELLAGYASGGQITDRAVADGDTVNIDYVGSVDGVEFSGGSTGGAGTDVTIGVTSYIDDFLEQLIGHTPGETINVEVTFPDVYHEESLQGKDAVFVTTINYIVDEKPPELTDDFVKANFFDSHSWETVAAMREGVTGQLQNAAVREYISEYLMNEAPVSSVPDILTDYQEKAMLRYYIDGANYYGVGLEDFLKTYVGVSSVDELIDGSRDMNTQNARYALVLQAVAEDANISVNEEDMVKYLSDYSQHEEEYGLPYLKQLTLFQKVVDHIAVNSVLE